MAALIRWAKAHLSRGIHRFWNAGVPPVLESGSRALVVCLHMLTILPWACFYR